MRNKANRLEELFMRLTGRERRRPSREAMSIRSTLMRVRAGSAFGTLVRREFSRVVRIWGQTLVPPAITARSTSSSSAT